MTLDTRRSRARRVLGVIGSVVGITFTFAAATTAAVVIHLDRPATRRLVATQVNAILASTLAGKIEIQDIGSLGLRGIDGVRVRVSDPEGIQVLQVDGVRVRIGAIAAARSALFGKGPIVIDVPSASILNGDVNLDADAAGNLRIANAFVPKNPDDPQKPPEPPGRGVRVEAPEVKLGHAWVHGTPPGAPLVDADVEGLTGHAHVDPDVVRAELVRVGLVTRALPRGVDPRGIIGGKFTMPAPNGQGMDVEALFEGAVSGIPTTVSGRMNDQRIDARVDARDPTGHLAGAAVSEVMIREPLSLHAEAHGELPHIETLVNVVLGAATVDANATVETGVKTRIKGRIAARNVDVSSLVESAPETRLGLDGHGDVAIGDDGAVGEVTVDTLPGTIDRQTLPRIALRASFAGQSAKARVRIDDPTMPTQIAVDVTPRAGGPDARTITANVESHIPDLHRLPKIGTMYGGSADIEASGRLSLPEQSIDGAKARVVLTKVRDTQIALGRVELTATAHGTADHPVIDAELHARELLTGALPLASVDARAHVEKIGSAITIDDAKVQAIRPGSAPIVATTRHVRIDGSQLRVEAAEILGVGDPIHADVTKNGAEIRGVIDAPKIDLPLAARLAGKSEEVGITKGTLGLSGGGSFRGGVAKGKIHADLRDLSVRSVHGASGVLDLAIDDRDVDLVVNADLREAGRIGLRTDRVVIGGHVDDPRSWKRVAGKVHLTGDVDLANAAKLVPREQLPVSDLRGSLTVQGRIGRDTPDSPPEIQLHAHTVGLAVAGRNGPVQKVNGIEIEEQSRLKSSDFDIGVDLRNDGASGYTNVAFRATDKHGMIAAFDAKATLPYADLVANPAEAKAKLYAAPLSVKIVVPPRRFDQMPAIAGVGDLQGAVEADIDASGTVLDPKLHVAVRTRNARSPAMAPETNADADVYLDYDGKVADLSAKVSSQGKQLAEIGAHVEASSRDVLLASENPNAPPLAWKGSARARLASFPLESVPQLADRRIHGNVSGEIALEGLHEDARVKGHIDLEKLVVGKAEYTKGLVTIESGDGKLAAKVRLDQKDGFLDASASTGLTWGAELAPTLDAKEPVTAKLVAQAFQAAAIQPFIEAAVPTLEGRIDANATASLVPGKPGAALDGKVTFRDGTVLVAALGEELRGVKASVALSPDGTIRVTDVFAKGSQGEVHADANVKLDGVRVADATANIRIPEKAPLDVAVQGTPVGAVQGTIKIKASQSVDGKNTKIAVDIPKLGVELPQVTKMGVQSLEEKENIRVGVFREPTRFVVLPLDKQDLETDEEKAEAANASQLDVDVRLGKITIARGNQVNIELAGNPKVSVGGGQTKMEGQIRIVRGWVDVQGKKFEVEKGTVTFNGESPPNPVIVVTAGWRAPDGSRIYADFVGPVKTGKVNLRSEPPRPKNEVLAMVLFGTADGANPSSSRKAGGQSAMGSAGTSVVGGTATQGLSDALDDLAGIKATARIDTSRSNNPRPELEVQISQKVSVGFAFVLGTPPITEPDKSFASVEYRFHRNWSVETTVGDRATTLLDAVWQKRY